MYNKEEFEVWQQKLRLFVIPTSTHILAEKLASKIRMLRERGKVIKIGSKWIYGGMDRLAQDLGITWLTRLKKILKEGDVKNFDHTVNKLFVQLYFDLMLIHEDPKSPDYEAKKRLIAFIAKKTVQRITRLYMNIWVLQVGGVPSGCFNTSHMDSWIMGLYFFLFATYQLAKAPESEKEELEEAILCVHLVLYGDDHVYNAGEGIGRTKLSALLFAKFMKMMFDVDIRDLYDDLAFCSKTQDGEITQRGMCFLKHFAVENPERLRSGQPDFLPYRETFDYIVRAVWGKETKYRNLVDVLLSVIGHAYGTFGSNWDAYDILFMMYHYIMKAIDKPAATILGQLPYMVDQEDQAKFRRMGIEMNDLRNGFPTRESLIKRNEYRPEVHDITTTEFSTDIGWATF